MHTASTPLNPSIGRTKTEKHSSHGLALAQSPDREGTELECSIKHVLLHPSGSPAKPRRGLHAQAGTAGIVGKQEVLPSRRAKQHTPSGNDSLSTEVIRCKNSAAAPQPSDCSHLISSLRFQDREPIYLPGKGDTDRRLCQKELFRSALLGDCNLRV